MALLLRPSFGKWPSDPNASGVSVEDDDDDDVLHEGVIFAWCAQLCLKITPKSLILLKYLNFLVKNQHYNPQFLKVKFKYLTKFTIWIFAPKIIFLLFVLQTFKIFEFWHQKMVTIAPANSKYVFDKFTIWIFAPKVIFLLFVSQFFNYFNIGAKKRSNCTGKFQIFDKIHDLLFGAKSNISAVCNANFSNIWILAQKMVIVATKNSNVFLEDVARFVRNDVKWDFFVVIFKHCA